MKTATTCALILVAATGCESIGDQPPGSSTFVATSSTTGFGGGFGEGTSVGSGGRGPFTTYDKPVVKASTPPPPISGGTLLVTAGGHVAAVADPERDQVVLVDLDNVAVKATVALSKGDQPGRLVDDAAGLIHVVLRGAGTIATIDPTAATVQTRQAVCTHPRGIAYDAKANAVHVACVGGELVTLDATTGALRRQLAIDSDLRDVVVDGDHLMVSRFRAAEILVVEADGTVSTRIKPPGFTAPDAEMAAATFAPAVAWRMTAAPKGGVVLAFQEDQTSQVVIRPGGYGGLGCGGIVRGAVGVFHSDGTGGWTRTPGAVLPVDVAIAPDGARVALASAGAIPDANPGGIQPMIEVSPPDVDAGVPPIDGCSGPFGDNVPPPSQITGQVVALAYDPSGRLLVQTREPSLIVGNRAVILPGDVVADTGHELFHLGTMGGIACASCHPEGHEDGHVWKFQGLGDRRTQAISGGLLGTEPFHWGGDEKDFPTLTHDVLSGRMSGPQLQDGHIDALASWIDHIPPWKPVTPDNPAAVDRGHTLFNDPQVGCSSCHSGAKMTNNTTVDVGTGAAFQVPSLLGLAYRAPYMHQGCASTIEDRFGTCGGTRHGNTSSLEPSQVADLVAYLKSL
jgi:hypothetical protein